MLIFQLSANKYGLGLSNELLFSAEEAAKLLPVKVQGLKKLLYATPIFFVKRGLISSGKNFFCPPTFTGHSLAAF